MNQSELRAITCHMRKEREKPRLKVAIDFGFASHWLKNGSEIFYARHSA